MSQKHKIHVIASGWSCCEAWDPSLESMVNHRNIMELAGLDSTILDST